MAECDAFEQMLPRDFANTEVVKKHSQLVFEPLVKRDQQDNPSMQLLLSGSQAEYTALPNMKWKKTPGEEELNNGVDPCYLTFSDLDFLVIPVDTQQIVKVEMCAAHSQVLSESSAASALCCDTRNCAPGFTRILKLSSEHGEVQYDYVVETDKYNLTNSQKLGSAAQAFEDRYNYESDVVLAYRCNRWPDHLKDVFNRTHSPHWINADLLQKLHQSQILLVHKSAPCKNHAIEQHYRFSFSLPEQVLSRSLDDNDRYVFLLCKILCKFYLRGKKFKFCTYYLKTQFYWILSKGPLTKQTSTKEAVMMLLGALRDTFKIGELPHFFIPSFNLLHYLRKDECSSVANVLHKIIAHLLEKVLEVTAATVVENYRATDAALDLAQASRQLLTDALISGDKSRHKIREAGRLLQQANQLAPVTTQFMGVYLEMLLHAHALQQDARVIWQDLRQQVINASRQLNKADNMRSEKDLCRRAATRFLPEHSALFHGPLRLDIKHNAPLFVYEQVMLTFLLQQRRRDGVDIEAKKYFEVQFVNSVLTYMMKRNWSKPNNIHRKDLSFNMSLLGHQLMKESGSLYGARAFAFSYHIQPHSHTLQYLLSALYKEQQQRQTDGSRRAAVDSYDVLFSSSTSFILSAAWMIERVEWQTVDELLAHTTALLCGLMWHVFNVLIKV